MAVSIYGSKICLFSRKCYYLKPTGYGKFYGFANYMVLQGILKKKENPQKCTSNVSLKRFFWESFPRWSLAYLYEKDKLNRENHEIVYRYKVFNYIFYGQLMSMAIIAVQLYYSAIMVYSLYFDIPFTMIASTFGPYSIKFDLAGYCILSLFSLQNMILFSAAQRTPLRIYYNKSDNIYVFVFLGVNPFDVRHIYCKCGDLKELEYSTLGKFFGNFKLKDRKVVVQPNYFQSNEHFNRMLGKIP